ncbi:MAG TPA: DUF1707 domain-containing protein [Acidimicrobiales bacterium]|nr:DUF1707 domain-containing protein [Acidimicrobiales bacterium]
MPCRWDHPWYYAPRPSRAAADPNLRVSDTERNDVAETLSRHYADGRLDPNEFKERLDTAMAAKTRADLGGLMTDLPPLPSATPTPSRPRRRHTVLWLVALLLVVAWAFPWQAHWVWFPHIPWLLIGVVLFFFWRRSSWRAHRRMEDAA